MTHLNITGEFNSLYTYLWVVRKCRSHFHGLGSFGILANQHGADQDVLFPILALVRSRVLILSRVVCPQGKVYSSTKVSSCIES